MAEAAVKPKKNRGGRPTGENGCPKLLCDMRWVYQNPPERDRPRHAPIRKWLAENTNAFMTKMASMEAAWLEKKKSEKKDDPAQPAPEEQDEGQDKAFALLEKLLEQPS